MSQVVGTVMYIDAKCPPPGTFRSGDFVPGMDVKTDDGRFYTFPVAHWATLGQQVLVDDGDPPILVGPNNLSLGRMK